MKMWWLAALTALLLVASPTSGQMLRPSFVSPMGEKKVGQYVWVWRTEKIPVDHERQIEVDCPIDYVVTGGGYRESNAFGVGETTPTPGFDGWVVEAFASYSGPNTVTVYAGCAPASK